MADRFTGVPQFAPASVLVADCVMSLLPFHLNQTAVTTAPSTEAATCGTEAPAPVADRSIGVLQLAPASVLVADWMMSLLPLKRDQTAVTVAPSAAAASCGTEALRPAADRSTGVLQLAPVSEVVADWMMVLVPSERDQTAVTVAPSAAAASCGTDALRPAADSSTGVLQVAPASVLVADWMMVLLPSKRSHTAVSVPPSVDDTTWGLSALRPTRETSTGALQFTPPSALLADCKMLLLPFQRSQTAVTCAPSADIAI